MAQFKRKAAHFVTESLAQFRAEWWLNLNGTVAQNGPEYSSIDFSLWLAIFTGMSLVSGSIVHAANSWFSNYFMIAIGTLVTPLAIVIRDRYVSGKQVQFGKEFFLLMILSFGVACFTGGIIHIEINTNYSIGLILIGLILSFTAAMMKKEGSLADLRNRHTTIDKGE